jgi:hypothetical protein
VLRRIFGPEREEVVGDWRILHNEKLRNLYASPNIIKVIKSIRMKWAGHVACMGTISNADNILVGNLKGRDHSECLRVDWKEILYRIFGNRVGRCGLDASGSG